MNGLSVLMSVYYREAGEYLDQALNSMYAQTVVPEEIVLVEDGELTEELYAVIRKYEAQNGEEGKPELRIVRMQENVQLGRALAAGLQECRYEYVARMDADDIARPYRFEKQKAYLDEHSEIAVVGGYIAEFVTEGEITGIKEMPASPEDVYKYGKFRNPLNHMTVMFRKSAVIDSGSYRHFPGLEDYDLWIRMTAKGYRFANLQEILVEARTGEGFSARRGGKEYYARYKELRRLQHESGYTSYPEYILSLALTFCMTRMPAKLRGTVYRGLRK